MPIIPNNTLSSTVKLVHRADSDLVVPLPLSNATFTLDSSGVAGFFGGESAVRAMGTVYLMPGRRWLGWYNAPGAYEVAKQYSGLAKSHLFNALFPGSDGDPAKILMVDGQVGPEYTSLYSPTGRAPASIGHLGSLLARKVSQMPATKVFELNMKRTVDARVTFVKLTRHPDELDKLELFPSSSIVFTVITILISVGGCIACAIIADWFCFASIALGIIANGVACSVIGSGKLYLKHNPPPQAYTPGDVLLKTDTNIIVLVGNEGSVRPFTRGRFDLHFGEMPSFGREQAQSSGDEHDAGSPSMSDGNGGDRKAETPKTRPFITRDSLSRIPSFPKVLTVDVSVILLLFQFLAQLLLIPQGTLFGQLMFIGTLVPSWIYHSYLSTLGLDLQTRALFNMLSIQKSKDIFQYQLGTWTQAAVFACLVFRSIHPPAWLSSTTNADGQRQDDVLKVMEAEAEREKKSEVAKKEARECTEVAKNAYNEAEHKAREAAEHAEHATKAAADAKKAATKAELEAKVAEADAEVKARKPGPNAGNAAEDAASEAATKKLEAATKKLEAAEKADKAGVADADAEAARKAAASRRTKVKEAEKAERELANKVAAAKSLNEARKKEKEARVEQDDSRTKQQKQKEDNALQELLDALLPGQTDVWRAFKQSLVRKLSEVKDNSGWAFTSMESGTPFEFSTRDTLFSVQGGDSSSQRLTDRKDLDQLRLYQGDARIAFTAWKRGNIVEMAQHFQ